MGHKLMLCPYCGGKFDLEKSPAWINEGSRRCPRCGGDAEEISKATNPEKINKGTWIEPTSCEICGASLERGCMTTYTEIEGMYVPTRYVCFKCADAERVAEYVKTGTLSIKVILSALLQGRRRDRSTPNHVYHIPEKTLAKILDDNNEIEAGIASFERNVWYAGLQEYTQKAEYKGHLAKFRGLRVMLYAMCGRAMVTIEEKGKASITVITAEDEKREGIMGLQGICATRKEALDLLSKAIGAYKKGKLVFHPDTDVSVL